MGSFHGPGVASPGGPFSRLGGKGGGSKRVAKGNARSRSRPVWPLTLAPSFQAWDAVIRAPAIKPAVAAMLLHAVHAQALCAACGARVPTKPCVFLRRWPSLPAQAAPATRWHHALTRYLANAARHRGVQDFSAIALGHEPRPTADALLKLRSVARLGRAARPPGIDAGPRPPSQWPPSARGGGWLGATAAHSCLRQLGPR